MGNAQKNQHVTDYLVTPGEVLDEYLDSFEMTQVELAARTGLTPKTINEIVKGKSPVTPNTALKLERVLGRPAHFWNNLERRFQEDHARLAEQKQLVLYLDWLKKVPVNSMAKMGWIPTSKDKLKQLEIVLGFFGVASPDQWKNVWQDYQVEYRQTQRFVVCAEAVSAWLRQGEIMAQQIECEPFSKKLFQNTLKEIRGLTNTKREVFEPKLVNICSASGVAVVFAPELPKTRVYGATRWLGKKAVIQLSLRYKSNDMFWFTFFHEAGHILQHGRKEIFIEGKGLNNEKEGEADAFARDLLIPPAALRRFIKGGRPTLAAIIRFADEVGIAPGIVVGRLQHDRVIEQNTGNKLKLFYAWDSKGVK